MVLASLTDKLTKQILEDSVAGKVKKGIRAHEAGPGALFYWGAAVAFSSVVGYFIYAFAFIYCFLCAYRLSCSPRLAFL